MVRDGIPYVLVPLGLALLAFLLGYWPVAVLFLALTGFMAYFFRDPHRTPPAEPGIIVSPADGRVTRAGPLNSGEENSPLLVSIFLSPLDVHINRAPIAGRIVDMAYTEGKFLIATSEKASLLNEQNSLTIAGESLTVGCKQIAGILARRIVCWKKPGDEVALGERFGMIKFGSRTDLIMPPSVELRVKEGTRVRGGATVIAKLRNQ
ncbi:MAG: phosphatidylserine decarboxylase [Blastocatellia bacterium]|jgi:phosphatidylserine decarboxylase|nr:phosphatidylserine decarboxylase [Blastocatellia bacterium]